MPRTFSLARLLLVITAFSVLCALAVNFPKAALSASLMVALAFPTILVWSLLIRISRYRAGLAFACVVGATPGLLFFPIGLALFGTTRDSALRNFVMLMIIGIGPAMGALLASSALLTLGGYVRRRES
jgi:glucose uptake protein GlcU